MSENELDDSLSIECAPDCQHSRAEHAAFGAELSVVTDHLERLKAENVRMEAAQYWLELRDELKSEWALPPSH